MSHLRPSRLATLASPEHQAQRDQAASGPLGRRCRPVVVPVAIEPNETVSEPRAMFARIATLIARVGADAAALSPAEREEVLARLTAPRPVGRVGGRSLRIKG